MKCFISHSYNTDISEIKRTLLNLDVTILNQQIKSSGSTIAELIRTLIKESDFVLAVIDKQNTNVLYELGVAKGLNKKIFIVSKEEEKIPSVLAGEMHLKTNYNYDNTLLKLSLENFIIDFKKRNRKKQIAQDSKKLSDDLINSFEQNLSRLKDTKSEESIIDFLTSLLNQLNVKAVSELQIDKGKRVDIAIANNNANNYLGNPIIIEVKRGDLSRRQLQNGVDQLRLYLEKSEAQIGILITQYKFSNEYIRSASGTFNILIFSIEEFARGIVDKGFEAFVTEQRNFAKHNL